MGGRSLLLASLVLVVGFAPAPLPRTSRQAPADDQAKLQGEWVVVEQHYHGKQMQQRGEATYLTIARDVWTFSASSRVTSKWTVRLDPAASPRVVDLKGTDRNEGITILGIYRLDGGQLKFAYEESDGKRPTKFDTSDGSWMMVLKRR